MSAGVVLLTVLLVALATSGILHLLSNLASSVSLKASSPRCAGLTTRLVTDPPRPQGTDSYTLSTREHLRRRGSF